jgi:hypothetical protein
MKRYPAVMVHLKKYQEQLEARWDKGEHWWELRACAYYDLFEKPKIFYPDIAKESRFALSPSGQYFGNTCYFIPSADPFLLGVLNSKAVWFYFSNYATVLGDAAEGGRLRFFQQDVVKIPIPRAHLSSQQLIARLAEQRLKLESGPAATALEVEIDVLVCKLYGLSWEQAKVVDPGLALSKEEYDAVELPPNDEPSNSMVSEPGGPVTGLTDEGTLFGQPVVEAPEKRGAGGKAIQKAQPKK